VSAVIEVENLEFSFDGRRPVLRGIRFQIEPGGSLAVLGANGSGKSTLLWCILGLLKARGVVRLFGEPRSRRSLARVGVVFQNPEDQLFMPRLVEDLSLTLLNPRCAHWNRRAWDMRRICRPPSSAWDSASAPPSPPRWSASPSCWCWTSPPRSWTGARPGCCVRS
jgi:energy-coupling factor transporter ATP-binding protein EcfA2